MEMKEVVSPGDISYMKKHKIKRIKVSKGGVEVEVELEGWIRK